MAAGVVATLAISAAADPGAADPGGADKPLLRDFMGLNGHTVLFDPQVYRPVAGLVRDYHNLSWDVGGETDFVTTFPFARNGVNWDDDVYGEWVDQGFRVNVAIQFAGIEDQEWVDPAADAKRYGRAFAQYFGPTVGNGLVDSVQIGNEPGHMSDAVYKTVFRNMAEGIREVDPNLTIVSPNVTTGASYRYAKSLSLWEDMLGLVDVFAVHTYPQAVGWPTWESSYPEDPSISYLRHVRDIIDWRDRHAAGKQVWITEFGYDSSTHEPDPDGPMKDWIGVTDTQQAQYLIRSFLAFSEMDVERAYMFWFDDNDVAGLHGSSGLTRNGVPKPSYWAMSHLYQTLGDYRFKAAVREDEGGLYIYAYEHEDDPHHIIWAIWSATGADGQTLVTLEDLIGTPLWADRTPLTSGPAPQVDFEVLGDGGVRLAVGGSPVFLRMHVPEPAAATILVLGAAGVLRRPRRRTGDPANAS